MKKTERIPTDDEPFVWKDSLRSAANAERQGHEERSAVDVHHRCRLARYFVPSSS